MYKSYPKGDPRRYRPDPLALRIMGKIRRFFTWTLPKTIRHAIRRWSK